jgi:hypothetical protein
MLAATNMLRPPPARIGKISKDFALPRSVPVKNLVGAAGGVVLLAIFVLPFLPNFEGLVITLAGGSFLGVLAVTWSPIKGESLLKWAELQADSRRKSKVVINGKVVRAYIGLAPLHWSAAGKTALRPGAVEVHPGSYDDRGVLVPHQERFKNLPPFPQS